jgi:hypothetical protein
MSRVSRDHCEALSDPGSRWAIFFSLPEIAAPPECRRDQI